MRINKPSCGPAGNLARLLAAFMLLLVAFGARADYTSDCTSRYAQSGAIPGTKWCALDAASNSPGGPGGYACLNDIDLIKKWCAGETDPQPEKSCPVADPVYPGSGAVTLGSTDFVSGDDMPMVFSRTYRSASLGAAGNAMGPVWFHNWQRQLNLASANNGGSSKVVAFRENGEPVTFNWSGGYWRTAGFTGLALAQNGSGWTLTDLSSDTTETYSAQGVLLSERTRTGFVRTLSYDGSGRLATMSQHGDDAIAKFDLTLRFDYDDKGRLVRLTDPANSFTQYGYDANSNLISVTWPDGNVRRYVYDDTRFKNAITGEIDETGTRIATWTYDSQGRANAVSHPDSSRNVQFTYANGATTLSYGQNSLTMNFSSIGGMVRPTTTVAAKGAASTTWDATGKLLSQTGVSGSSTQYAYDDAGRPVRAVVHSVLSGTSVTSVRYADSTSLRPSTIASPGRMRAFVYDAKGNVTGLSEFSTSDATGESGFDATASGQQQTIGVRYDALNRVAGAKVYVNGVMTEDWVYFYDTTGNRATAQNLLTGWLLGETYRDAAHRVTQQNGNYRETHIAYDARGRITRFTYNENATNATGGLARLLTVDYGYSADGRVVSRTGKVSKNGAAATLISSDEVNQWLDNYEAGMDPAGPPANLMGWVKALQFVQEPGLQPVCVECVFYAGPRLAWTVFQLARDPIWSMLRNTGKPDADAQQCAEIPEQLTLAEQMGMLKDARSIKGDFNLGEGTRADADALARDLLGHGYRSSSRDESILISKDGLRQYRPPNSKDSPYATTGVQANFQSRSVPHGEWQNNGHLNVRP
ncbi:YD repeat-containing protein [Paraburkholderia sp. GAS348]